MILHLARKEIKDPEGQDIAKMLKDNKWLRKLELEGNFLGPLSAKEFGRALKVNTTLKYLDLDNNYLTNNQQDTSGVTSFTKCLYKNKTLLSLHMANNGLKATCGE